MPPCIKSKLTEEANLEKLSQYLLIDLKADMDNRVVLGATIMEAVWSDMRSTQLPTWITAAPYDWGTPERGKLSADQWRVICTIHLVITLIRLWGNETGHKQDLLQNFMDLSAWQTSVSPPQIRLQNSTSTYSAMYPC